MGKKCIKSPFFARTTKQESKLPEDATNNNNSLLKYIICTPKALYDTNAICDVRIGENLNYINILKYKVSKEKKKNWYNLCIFLYAFHYILYFICISLFKFHYMHVPITYMNFTICLSPYGFHSMCFTICTSLNAFQFMHFTLCISLYAFHSRHFIP